jgi:hypothetical protein
MGCGAQMFYPEVSDELKSFPIILVIPQGYFWCSETSSVGTTNFVATDFNPLFYFLMKNAFLVAAETSQCNVSTKTLQPYNLATLQLYNQENQFYNFSIFQFFNSLHLQSQTIFHHIYI